MAITNLVRTNEKGTYMQNDVPSLIGDGAPADADVVCTDTALYPVGTEYFDITGKKLWKRIAAVGVAADFVGVLLA